MGPKGRQLSVLIAGATGNIGRELVSLLVSHPDVARVVALSRTPVPVNRWRARFPGIHSGDALRCLSVVSVDWDKIAADATHVPLSYVRRGVWDDDDVAQGLMGAWRRMRDNIKVRVTGMIFGATRSGDVESDRKAEKTAAQGTKSGDSGGGSNNGDKSTTNKAGNGDASRGRNNIFLGSSGSRKKKGYVKMPMNDSSGNGDTPKAFLNELLKTPFYKSVFSGHNVVINCLGSNRFFSGSDVNLVDYQYAIALSKIVRIFNCMVHAEPSGEEEALMEKYAKKHDSIIWGEIYAACYGQADFDLLHAGEEGKNSDGGDTALSHPEQRLARGGEGTLCQYTQVSVMGSSRWNPLPYFRVHNECDNELISVFNRGDHDMRLNFLYRRGLHGAEDDDGGGSCEDGDVLRREETGMLQRRAEMFLRRDVVKLWDNSHLTIWRPGLLQRDNPRPIERLIGLFLSQVDVKYLAKVILDDINASVEDERGFDEMGSVKVIGGNNVAVRVKMKIVETEILSHKRCKTASFSSSFTSSDS